MRRALFLIVVVAVLIGGGFLSMVISQRGSAAIPGLIVQTNNPEGSVSAVTANKGAQFFIFASIALGSVVGMGVTLAVIFWFLNRQVTRVKQMPDESFEFTLNAAKPNSIGGLITKHPSVTVAVIILALITLSVGAALVLGVFTPK